jgi:hypothetical protein
MQNLLPIAVFAARAQLARRTIERKIARGEIAAEHVQRHGRRVFIDAAALTCVTPDLSRHDATMSDPAATPPDTTSELIVMLTSMSRVPTAALRPASGCGGGPRCRWAGFIWFPMRSSW